MKAIFKGGFEVLTTNHGPECPRKTSKFVESMAPTKCVMIGSNADAEAKVGATKGRTTRFHSLFSL